MSARGGRRLTRGVHLAREKAAESEHLLTRPRPKAESCGKQVQALRGVFALKVLTQCPTFDSYVWTLIFLSLLNWDHPTQTETLTPQLPLSGI